jgi:hypothetical protein
LSGPKDGKLSELFGQHQERKSKEAAAAQSEEAAQARWTEGCKKPLLQLVRPVMEQFVAQSKTAGHSASLAEALKGAVYPSIYFEFTPADEKRSLGLASKITFQCYHPTGMKVMREVRNSNGETRRSSGELEMVQPVEAVTSEWVREQLLAFVRDVLSAN